ERRWPSRPRRCGTTYLVATRYWARSVADTSTYLVVTRYRARSVADTSCGRGSRGSRTFPRASVVLLALALEALAQVAQEAARALRDVGDRLRQREQVERLRVLHHRDDQPLAVGKLDREAEVDVLPRDDLVAAQLAVHPRVVAQRLGGRARDEREERRVDTVG